MKYNEDIDPLYKSIGEKLEKWIIADPWNKRVMHYLSGRYPENSITLDNSYRIKSRPHRFIFKIPECIFTIEEQEYIGQLKEPLKFNLGEKDDNK